MAVVPVATVVAVAAVAVEGHGIAGVRGAWVRVAVLIPVRFCSHLPTQPNIDDTNQTKPNQPSRTDPTQAAAAGDARVVAAGGRYWGRGGGAAGAGAGGEGRVF